MLSVDAKGPASAAGVQDGDVIVSLAGHPVTGIDDLMRLLADDLVDTPLRLVLIRRMERVEREVVLRDTTAQGSGGSRGK